MTDQRLQTAQEILQRRIEAVFPSRAEAEKRLAGAKALRFYLGIDPTGPQVHLGHLIPLLLLKDIARLGHEVILLIGDFTARIGDPTGKDAARIALSESEVKKNEKTYVQQVQKLFGDVPFRVEHNSAWLKEMTFEEVVKLAGRVTVQQMIARDMFQERLKNERPIYLHEFLYPLMQGYDSVAMDVDGEVGGTDQTFNMLIGRELVKELLNKDKLVLTTKLLVDTVTGKKMSKSEGGLIGVQDEPQEIRRKVLALDDKMIVTVFELCTEKDQQWIEAQGKNSPRQLKEELARELIKMFHGESALNQAKEAYEFKGPAELLAVIENILGTSRTSAKNLFKENAVTVNGSVVTDWKYKTRKDDKVRVGKGTFIEIK